VGFARLGRYLRMPSFRFWVTVPTLLVAAAALSSCGGGGGGASSAIPASANGGSQSANATLSIGIQSTGTAGATRSTQSLPTNSSAIAIYTYLANGNPPSTPTLVASLVSAPPCTAASGPRTCSITFSAPVSTTANPTVVAVQIYDTAPINCTNGTNCTLKGGNVIAGGIASQAINVNGANSVNVTLSSVSQQVSISGSSPVALPTLAPIIGGGSGIVGGSLNITVPGNSGLSNGTVLTVGGVAPTQLTVQISSNTRRPQFTSGAGNTYVYGLSFALNPSQTLNVPLQVGASFQVNASLGSQLGSSGTLSVAQFNGTTYADVGTIGYTYSAPTLTITDTGTSGIKLGSTGGVVYVIYLSAPSVTLTPTAGFLNVYYLPINGNTTPQNATGGDPATFNMSLNLFNLGTPPAAFLLANQTFFNGGGTALNSSTPAIDFAAHPPAGVALNCGSNALNWNLNGGGATCAANGTLANEWMAVQAWPFYVSTNGSYTFGASADDAVWLVLASSPFTYSQSAGTVVVNASGVNAYRSTLTGTMTGTASLTAGNTYWVTMEYAELAGGAASLTYGWKPPGAEAWQQMTQGVVSGQVTIGGSPKAGTSVTAVDQSGTHSLTTDSNGKYGYNVTFSTGASVSVTVSATSGSSTQSATTTVPVGQAIVQNLAL
jgi:hypothetical protein